MDMQLRLYNNHGMFVETSWLEELLFRIGDICNIRIVLEPALITGAAAVLGGILGALAGGRSGAVFGAGLAGAIGYGSASEMTLREAWQRVKDKLDGLLNILLEFLQTLDYVDYVAAAEILMASTRSREEVCEILLQYITAKLGAIAHRALQ